MKKLAALLLSLVMACAIVSFPIAPAAPAAYASTKTGSSTAISSPYPSTYYYYSDLAFKDGGSATIAVGKTKKLALVNLNGGEISWVSSDDNVATVTQKGIIKAKRAGVARVTAKNLKTHRSVTCTVKVYKKCTQAQARKAILALKATYYPGRRWTNSNYYYWQAANCHCYGCIAFVGIASDRAFGKFAPLKRHANFSSIKVGDHVRIAGSHSVIVLYKKKKSIIVAEGNYDSTFKWGRSITQNSLMRQGFYVETRY